MLLIYWDGVCEPNSCFVREFAVMVCCRRGWCADVIVTWRADGANLPEFITFASSWHLKRCSRRCCCCCCCQCCCSITRTKPSPTRLNIARKSVRGLLRRNDCVFRILPPGREGDISCFWRGVILMTPFYSISVFLFIIQASPTQSLSFDICALQMFVLLLYISVDVFLLKNKAGHE